MEKVEGERRTIGRYKIGTGQQSAAEGLLSIIL